MGNFTKPNHLRGRFTLLPLPLFDLIMRFWLGGGAINGVQIKTF